MEEKVKFYKKTWFIILLLTFFFPVGLFLMWKYANWSKAAKIIVTVIIAILFIFGMTNQDDSPATPADKVKVTEETMEAETEETEEIEETEATEPTEKATKETSQKPDLSSDYKKFMGNAWMACEEYGNKNIAPNFNKYFGFHHQNALKDGLSEIDTDYGNVKYGFRYDGKMKDGTIVSVRFIVKRNGTEATVLNVIDESDFSSTKHLK